MKGVLLRVAVWASAGYLVSVGWGIYYMSVFGTPGNPTLDTLARLTVPIALSNFGPSGLAGATLWNAATYGAVGVLVEGIRGTVRRHYGRPIVSN